MAGYTYEQFEKDMTKNRPGFMETYIVPGLLVVASVKAKKPLGRWTRRAIFTAGCYMMMRNYERYKQSLIGLAQVEQNIKKYGFASVIPEVPNV